MMATEATSEKPVDVSITEASLPQTDSAEITSQHVDAPSAHPVNGTGLDEIENKQIAEIVDELVNSAEVSVSGGSDTEASTSKANISSADHDKGHVRTSSTVKKPLQKGFKSVSVNRTFLGAKSAANSTSRPESATASVAPAPATSTGSSASKLKLVAKSGSSLGASAKTLTTNGKAPSAPDPNTVWNRNRPVPQPEPKKLSDEELMSKYGIHMADRLRPENDRGQSNWADEDDDEEWAPDTITWTDGTKITLPQVDEIPPPTPPAAPAVPFYTTTPTASYSATDAPAVTTTTAAAAAAAVMSASAKDLSQTEKPKSPAPGIASGSARASPSVKPGVLASGKGLILKGAPEKPTLVAKAPAPPTPVKSPWAPLPPIDKASPVVMDISNNQQQHTYFRGYPPRDASLAKSSTPPPAKEIAADDFSRAAWRDGQTGGNRELFNSQSGRYEPVHDRRGSRQDARNDPLSQRHPALLQRRPSQHDHQGPAEPSAAFQTSRSSGQDPMPYGRRRNSSNVSGGSGSLLNRLGKPHDTVPPENIQHSATASQGSGPYSPVRSQPAQPWQPRPSPGQTHATPQHIPPPQEATSPSEDEVQLQKRLMRERRELAIKRRLDEEAREEAARKERIRLKLEAMGPAPERKSKKEEPKDVPLALQQRDGLPTAVMSKEQLAAAAAERSKTSSDSPASSTTKQETAPGKADTQANGVQPAYNQSDASQGGPARSGPPSGSQTAAPWPETRQSSDRLPSWNAGPQATSRNVWGAPGNDRTLGNGTFNADLAPLADSQPAQPASNTSRPTPIGPPGRSASQGQHGRVAEQPPSRLAPIGPPSSRSSLNHTQAPGPRPRNLWATADIATDDRAIRLQNQKRLEEHMQELATQGLNVEEAHNPVKDTWRGVDVTQGKRISAAAMTKVHGESQDGPPNAAWNARGPASAHEPAIGVDRHESVQANRSQDYRQHQGPDGLRSEFSQRPPTGPAGTAAPGPLISQPRAGSRFFPHSGLRDTRQDGPPGIARSKSRSPPPPTMDGHPAYDGERTHPHVALPPARPVVKLPPPATRLPPAPSQATAAIAPLKPAAPPSFAAVAGKPANQSTGVPPPSRGVNHGGITQKPHEIATQENWQEKINSLMGRSKPISPAKPMSVDSSSKSAFDAHSSNSATVSLPGLSSAGSTITDNCSITSREMAEECFGEQEMGSLPLVHLPDRAPDALWPDKAAATNWHPIHAKYRVDAAAAEPPRFPTEYVNSRQMFRIYTPGMDDAKMVPAPFAPRNKSNPRRPGRGGGRHVSRGGPRGLREPGDLNSASTTDRPDRPERPSSNRGRGAYRARSENWGRHSSSATQVA
ncbi:hypothetical protein BJ170DRAFT_363739 [Xylariales sp. AK1849]|nr:hypothetical protein BJ170DRAFT_363739 [Xylariales sp. AK1849]